MTGYFTFNRHLFRTYRVYLLCGLLIFLASACGNDNSAPGTSDNIAAASSDSGSASFAIQWNASSAERASGLIKRAIVDCAGVESITCEVYNDANNPIAYGGPWDCSDHHGTIEYIPAGSNRIFAILGWSATGGGGDAIYQGQTAGITINPGETANVGTIDAYAFVPTGLGATAVPDNQIDLAWDDLGFDTYRIYRNGTSIDSSTSTTYSDTNLSANTEYCYTVSAVDSFGNESGPSGSACASAMGTCSYTISPTSDSFSASADTGSITVTTNSGCSWNAVVTSGADWINITSGASGSSTGNVNYSVDANNGTNTRYGVISVAGYNFNITQEGVTVTCTDSDSDEFYAESGCGTSVDCDDSDPNIYPGATETCNGKDDNCDGIIDEGCSAPVLSNPNYSLVGLNDTEDPQGGSNYSTFNLSFDFFDIDGDANEAAGATLDVQYQFTGGGNFFEVDHTDDLVGVNGYEDTVQLEEHIRFDDRSGLVVTFILTDGAGHNSNSLQMTIDRPSGAN
jgi:hypothetical protein